jgi:hypothetical protein
VKGYDVVRSDGQRIGRVADALSGFLVVELAGVVRTRLALPTEFTHATDCDRKVVITTPTALLEDAPRVKRSGTFDADAAARHFGVAGTITERSPEWPTKRAMNTRSPSSESESPGRPASRTMAPLP